VVAVSTGWILAICASERTDLSAVPDLVDVGRALLASVRV
jgi:hypothetical protein